MRDWLKIGLASIISFLSINSVNVEAEEINYKAEMVELISEVHDYARAKNKENFFLIANGGAGLFEVMEDSTQEQVDKLAKNIDGVMAESVFYGYAMQMDGKTPKGEQKTFKWLLGIAQEYGLTVLSLDYCSEEKNKENSYKKNSEQNYISWASSERYLNYIPVEIPYKENKDNITKLPDIKNYMIILNPAKYATKDIFINHLASTDYDLLIIDLFHLKKCLTAEDIEKLHYKQNGSRRLIAAYMSLGEAETYRYYWQEDWLVNRPKWISDANTDWENNFHVKYWYSEWKSILMGSENSYLDKIISAGFDGVFLDVVDGYHHFSEK